MFGIGFCMMVVPGLEFTPAAEAAAFKHVEFFRFHMAMGSIAGTRCHAHEGRSATRDRVEKKHFGRHAPCHLLPSALRRFDEGQAFERIEPDIRVPFDPCHEPFPKGSPRSDRCGSQRKYIRYKLELRCFADSCLCDRSHQPFTERGGWSNGSDRSRQGLRHRLVRHDCLPQGERFPLKSNGKGPAVVRLQQPKGMERRLFF